MEGRRFGRFLRLFVLVALTAALVLMIGTAAFSQETQPEPDKECYLVGDMNADGVLTSADAVYLLYYYTDTEGKYAVNQNADINGDEEVTADDAIDLLYAYYGWSDESMAVGQEVHDYYDPAWIWSENNGQVAAQATRKCACGKTETLNVELELVSQQNATCSDAGSKVYRATTGLEGVVSEYTQILPALNHAPGELVSSDPQRHYAVCTRCDAVVNEAHHTWTAGTIVKGDCQTQSYLRYTCSCGAEDVKNLGYEACSLEYVQDVPGAEKCTYEKQYRCTVCQEVSTKDGYTKHNYETKVTQQATCQESGVKVSACVDCGDVRSTEPIAANNHDWVEGDVVAGFRIDECSTCHNTKTTAVVAEDGILSNDALNSSEVAVGDATLSMDQDVKDNLNESGEIQITVVPVDKADVQIKGNETTGESAEEKRDQILGNIYDFNLNADGEKVENFGGEITISLPYELEDGEDVDSIGVWYIHSDGTLELIDNATYSNGYVTFTVEHFSYYTVTRLTNAERCERYGHIWTASNKAATCTADGYTRELCQRCQTVRNEEVVEAFGHTNVETGIKAATCTNFGSRSLKCETCNSVTNEVIAPNGHTIETTTEEADCKAPGKVTYTCTVEGCDYAYEEALAQKTHSYKYDSTIAPTCTMNGYDAYICEICGDSAARNETLATGHAYSTETARWNWTDVDADPVLSFSCVNCDATKEMTPSVVDTAADCVNDGFSTATAYYNGVKFEMTLPNGEATGHSFGENWFNNESQHYHRCEDCGVQQNVADHSFGDGEVVTEVTCSTDGVMRYTCSECTYSYETVLEATNVHNMGEGKVTREPTCTLTGVMTYTCTYDGCGYTEKESVAANGHSFGEDDVCTVCGKIDACDHTELTVTKTELPENVCGEGVIYLVSCACGQRQSTLHDIGCEFEWEDSWDEDGQHITQRCATCGFTVESDAAYENVEDPCVQRITFTIRCVYGDAVLLEYTEVSENAHPILNWEEPQTITGMGMCDLTVQTGSCACGQVQKTECFENCNWEYVTDGVFTCTECNATRTHTGQTVGQVGCYAFDEYTYVYTNADGNEVYRYTTTAMYQQHNEQVTNRILLGQTCEDGYALLYECTNCDYEAFGYNWSHETYLVESYQLSDYGMCGGYWNVYRCLCGQESHFSSWEDCEWAYVEDNEEGSVYTCAGCNATRVDTIYFVAESSCVTKELYTRVYKDPNGEEIFAYTQTWTHVEHHYVCTSTELYGESCEDGVKKIYTCETCGITSTSEYYGHEVEAQYTNYGSESGICGITFIEYVCACGQEQRSRLVDENACSFTRDETYTGEGERWYCTQCGAVRLNQIVSTKQDDCVYLNSETVTYSNANGDVLCTFTTVGVYETHEYTIQRKLLGQSCHQGVEVTYTCVTCSSSHKETYYDHVTEERYYDVTATYGMCGGWLRVEDCACGEYKWTSWEFDCNFQLVETVDGVETYFCAGCQTTMSVTRTMQRVDDCISDFENSYVLSNATMGEQTLNLTETGRNHDHKWVYTLTLKEGATSCEQGYFVQESCERCGRIWGQWEEAGHNTYIIVREMISADQLCGELERLTYSCACGQETRTEYTIYRCNFEYTGYNEELDCETYQCAACATVRLVSTVTTPVAGVGCQKEVVTTYTYQKGEDVVLTYQETEIRYRHQFVAQFTMNGKSCEEGYSVYNRCMHCGIGHNVGTYNYCQTFVVARIEAVSEYDGFCGASGLNIHACPCGKNVSWSLYASCNFQHIGQDEATGKAIFQCVDCGLMRTENSITERDESKCQENVSLLYTFMAFEGEELKTVGIAAKTVTRPVHTYLYEFEMQGDTCADGYQVYQVCQYCEDKIEGESYNDCRTWLVGREQLELTEDCCSKLYQLTYACACGAVTEKGISFEGDCNFSWGYNEILERECGTCEICGIMTVNEYFENVIDAEKPCFRNAGWRHSYYTATGTELCTAEEMWRSESHTYIYTLNKQGDTCEAGYTANGTCLHCGATCKEENRTDCEQWLVGVETKVSDNACGTMVYQYNYSCACGAYTRSERRIEEKCSFVWEHSDALGRGWYTCKNCDLSYIDEYFNEAVDLNKPCVRRAGWSYTYYNGDTQLCIVQDTWRNVEHTYQFSFALNGETCAGSYTATGTCIYCQETGTWTGNSCDTFRTQRIDLTQYGLCGGYVDYYRCACGKESSVNSEIGCNYTWTDKYNEHGAQGRYCADCETTIYWQGFDTYDRPNCRSHTTYYLTLVQGEEKPLDVVLETNSQSHTFLMVGYEGNCGGEVTVHMHCKYCQKQETWGTNSEGHPSWETGFIDLEGAGACGGYLRFNSCVCGEQSNYWFNDTKCQWTSVSSQETQSDGNILYKQTRTCTECGLVICEQWVDIKDTANCRQIRERSIRVVMGETDLGSFSDRQIYTSHRYGQTVYTLMDGATSCEGGLICTNTCVDCGYTTTRHSYSHETYWQGKMDLSNFGSACGTRLECYGCACKRYQYWKFSEGYCDLDCEGTNVWVEGALNGGQYNTDGWVDVYSDAYIYTCAVTDPDCDLKVRMTTCWLLEGCEAVQYQIWQLGFTQTYNETTGQWSYGWDAWYKVATGERRTYHSYGECVQNWEETEDGTTIYTGSYTCTVCESRFVETWHSKDGFYVKAERLCVSTQTGKNQQWREYWENGLVHEGQSFCTYQKNSYIRADGTEWFQEYSYEYKLEEGCKRTTTWADSDGNSGSYEEEHFNGWNAEWTWEKMPTCSQSGVEILNHTCDLCDEIMEVTPYDRDPNGHSWSWNEDLQKYVCAVCQLESSNDADGTIIIEDLTTAEDTNYVVGYWNGGDGEFTVYASVILLDSAGVDNAIDLMNIEFTYLTVENDGVQALVADQAAIQEAAAAAMLEAGYTGSYAIRITFVPADDTSGLDYAITFDSQMAEGGNE